MPILIGLDKREISIIIILRIVIILRRRMIYSRQREIIMDTLAQMHGLHPSANEIYSRLHDEHPSISLATVYRNLGQLGQARKIMRIPVADGPDRYDDLTDGHLHMLCTECGCVCDLPHELVDGLCKKAAACSGYTVSHCDILFFGVCDACQKRHNILK